MNASADAEGGDLDGTSGAGRVLALGPHDIGIWLVPVPEAPDPRCLDRRVASLAPDERERFDRFRDDGARLQFVYARSALRRLLRRRVGSSAREGLTLLAGRFGKPRLAAGRIACAFNVSHTDGLAAIALTGGSPVGVDVERRRPLPADPASLFRRCLSEIELQRMQELGARSGEERFHDLWTLKEAYFKALGVGLNRDMRDVSLAFDRHGALVTLRDRAADTGSWRFVQASLQDDRIALALAMSKRGDGAPAGTVTVREHRFEDDGTELDLPLTVRDVRLGEPPGRETSASPRVHDLMGATSVPRRSIRSE